MLSIQRSSIASAVILVLAFSFSAAAASPDRLRGPVDPRRTVAISGTVHRLAQPQFDRGALDPATPVGRVVILIQPSAAQQADLDQLLISLQNPSSPLFHRWLTPEEFGNRFGLSP